MENEMRMKRIVGYENEQKELNALSEMLSNVSYYHSLGVRIPKGLVLHGAPGVGKSMMANSIARGSIKKIELRAAECCNEEAIENVHEAFIKAKEEMPCVLILDELDKIAGFNKQFYIHTNTEINKVLLQELDKLGDDDSILVVATCNSLDCLGDALLRPGRFDRQIKVPLPDEDNRKKIFSHYLSRLKLKNNLNIDFVAKMLMGSSCAMIECIVNEAALNCLQRGDNVINIMDVRYAINKSMFGGLPNNIDANKENRYKVAIHEAGHAIVAYSFFPETFYGASIIPQGDSKGHVEVSFGDCTFKSVSDVEKEIAVLLGGRVAESELLGEVYGGSSNDLSQAVNIAVENLTSNGYYGYKYLMFTKGAFEESMAAERNKYEINCKLAEVMQKSDDMARKIISTNKYALERIARALEERHFISKEEVEEIVKKDA